MTRPPASLYRSSPHLRQLSEICHRRIGRIEGRDLDLPIDERASKRIIIFTCKDDAFSSGLGMTTAYLASPHLVRLFEISGTHPDNELSKMNPDEVAAVVFVALTVLIGCRPGRYSARGWK